MARLQGLSCTPCRPGTKPLEQAARGALLGELDGWEIVDGHHLHKEFAFPDFVSALLFVNRVGAVAEAEQHHPDLSLAWGKVGIVIFTHAAGGLTENDFILAAKLDGLKSR